MFRLWMSDNKTSFQIFWVDQPSDGDYKVPQQHLSSWQLSCRPDHMVSVIGHAVDVSAGHAHNRLCNACNRMCTTMVLATCMQACIVWEIQAGGWLPTTTKAYF